MIWDGWASNDPVYPEYDDITYGMVMDYLFEDSNYYYWDYDYDTDSVTMNGTYTTFDYTMGMADEPTACDVRLGFDWRMDDF